MQWLLQLETERDPIATCRLMNIFRRKGVSVLRLELESGPDSISMTALVETREPDVSHIFNFLRRTEGVREVTCYHCEASTGSSAGAGSHGNGAAASLGRLANGDSSSVIHCSRSVQGDCEETAARKAVVEKLAVNK